MCLAATEAYVSDRALIQNTLQPVLLLVHTHTHTVAADGDLYGHRYKRHQFSLFHPPCLQQRTGRVYQLPPQHVRSSRRQPRCRRLKSVSAAPVRSPEQFIQTVPSVLTAEQEEQTPKTKDFSPGLIW